MHTLTWDDKIGIVFTAVLGHEWILRNFYGRKNSFLITLSLNEAESSNKGARLTKIAPPQTKKKV